MECCEMTSHEISCAERAVYGHIEELAGQAEWCEIIVSLKCMTVTLSKSCS